jgi:L-fuculose-phosphate aldolase
MDHEAERRAIIEACRNMNRLGLVKGTSGNISFRAGDGLLISPTGMEYDALEPRHIVPLRWDGSFEGAVEPSSEWRFHRDLLLARPDLNAVVHTHSKHATAVGILGRDIPAIHYIIAAAGGHDVRCAPYETFGTPELAARVVTAMEGRLACLLAHHGAITAGVTLAAAMALALTLEELAEQYLLLLPLGEPPVLPRDEMDRVVAKFATYGRQPGSAV